jgi:hypothetical protein
MEDERMETRWTVFFPGLPGCASNFQDKPSAIDEARDWCDRPSRMAVIRKEFRHENGSWFPIVGTRTTFTG